MSVAVGRTRPSEVSTSSGDAQVWRYQPPSGWASSPRDSTSGDVTVSAGVGHQAAGDHLEASVSSAPSKIDSTRASTK